MSPVLSDAEQRACVVAEARSWLRTPYHHHGRVKGAGVDCAMLPYAVYTACGVIADFNFDTSYAPQWHLHHSAERYLDIVTAQAREVAAAPGPGGFVLFKFGRVFSHGAIVVQWPLILHSYIGIGVLIDDAERSGLFRYPNGAPRERRFFDLWES
jgi:cell wall-associated NlpC family hydrolase